MRALLAERGLPSSDEFVRFTLDGLADTRTRVVVAPKPGVEITITAEEAALAMGHAF